MNLKRIKVVAEIVAGQSPPSEAVDQFEGVGRPFLQGNAEFGELHPVATKRCETATRRAAPGDILLSIRAPVGALNIADQAYGIGRGLAALRPRRQAMDERFLWWGLHSVMPVLQSFGVGSTYDAVTGEDIGNLPLPVPPIAEQRMIADFLDTETARINGLIAKKRLMVELLAEQAWAWALRLVLGDDGERRGLASPSGLYRLLPDGWSETALRHLGCEVQTGPFGSQLHAEEYVDGEWPVVNPMNIVGGEIVRVDSMTVNNDKRQELARHVLRTGDIVFARRGEMGRAGLVNPEHEGWLCGTGSLRLRLHGEYLVADYLALLLGTPPARAYFELSSVGSTMDNLNSEIVLALPTLVPPREEQHGIVAAVARRRTLTNTTTERLSRQIALLVEHRQALITAAVTGELDIAEAAA